MANENISALQQCRQQQRDSALYWTLIDTDVDVLRERHQEWLAELDDLCIEYCEPTEIWDLMLRSPTLGAKAYLYACHYERRAAGLCCRHQSKTF